MTRCECHFKVHSAAGLRGLLENHAATAYVTTCTPLEVNLVAPLQGILGEPSSVPHLWFQTGAFGFRTHAAW